MNYVHFIRALSAVVTMMLLLVTNDKNETQFAISRSIVFIEVIVSFFTYMRSSRRHTTGIFEVIYGEYGELVSFVFVSILGVLLPLRTIYAQWKEESNEISNAVSNVCCKEIMYYEKCKEACELASTKGMTMQSALDVARGVSTVVWVENGKNCCELQAYTEACRRGCLVGYANVF